ncbi:protein kinase domain-containing protein [Streptomyces sp. NBC_00211]|uniref:protein kinase domain-containing protein n=1 Tax=Streptomyces sp. NBC_00211 TaxID=2975683 RepID=UPI003244EE91
MVERLGRGGMGEVWAARDRDLRRDVAVKFLPRDADASPELLNRFEREAVAAAQINHPNVVTLHERGVHDGLQFLVMERVDGTSLTDRMRGGPLMELAEALRVAQEICAALVAAHQARVVHYDIKPSNVMLTADGRIKVVDFGIAGFTHTRTAFSVAPSTALSPAGTLEYGAPEQFLDSRGDERSDLYALGSVLFALLAGQPPFTGANGYIVLRRKIDEDAPPLADYRPDVPNPVGQLLTELLRRDPGERPQTAGAVHARLERIRSAATDSGQMQPPDDRGAQRWPSRTIEAPRTPPPPSGDPRHADTLDRTTRYRTTAVYGALVLFALASAVHVWYLIDWQWSTGWDGRDEAGSAVIDELMPEYRSKTAPLLIAQLLTGLMLVACWLAWFSRVRDIAGQFAPGQVRHNRSMAVAGWFIPLRNLLLPKQIADDIWHASTPASTVGEAGPVRPPMAWWVLWLVTFLTWPLFWLPWTETLSSGTEVVPGGIEDDHVFGWYEFEPLTWVNLALHIMVVPTAAVLAHYVRRLTARQTARLDTHPPDTFAAIPPVQ